ncbi:hypothetical protein [Pseudoxanthomonas composti]|nr:hypothetical protein [Pseudoxanthomonas composti]
MLLAKVGKRIAPMAVVMLLVSCNGQPQPPQPASKSTATEPSDMRTAVPLVRRLDPADTGPLELDFDVPALPDDDSPPLFIGVRIAGNDPSVTAEVARRLVDAGVSARVQLFHLDHVGQTQVTLLRSDMTPGSGTELIELPADGLVPGLMPFDSDFNTMQAAGLLVEESYRELAFALVPNLPAGRYRLVLVVSENRNALTDAHAELLVAYTRKAK